jgi:lysine-N-methylase
MHFSSFELHHSSFFPNMPLPLHTLPILERWDCHQCGVCCRGSIVPLNENDVARLHAQKWHEHPDFRGVKTTAPYGRGQQQLAKRADGSCVFLMPDGLCRIHKELGFEAKPLICRMFPLQVVPHEKQAVLTLRRACPSAAADRGRELSEQLADARAYVVEGELAEQGTAAPPFKLGEPAEWKRSRLVLESLRRITADERYPMIRRLVHGLELCRLLEQANTQDLANNKLVDLLRVLEDNIAEEAAPHFAERRQPLGAARVLFRQIGLEVVRLHPRSYHQPRWTSRLQLAWWAMKMVAGRGKLPQVHPQFPSAAFAQLEEPLGRFELSLYQPLARYFETTTASYQYALAQKSGWSVIESYRQLALLYPLGLWLLRWASVGRAPTANDMFEIIAALDRAQGYAPLTGLKQRSRIRTLAQLGELPALVAWYGR